MSAAQHRNERGVGTASAASPTPPLFAGGDWPACLRSRATEVEGEGDVGARSAAFPEGVEPRNGAAGVEVAATEVMPRNVALSPSVPLSGVVVTAGDPDAEA